MCVLSRKSDNERERGRRSNLLTNSVLKPVPLKPTKSVLQIDNVCLCFCMCMCMCVTKTVTLRERERETKKSPHNPVLKIVQWTPTKSVPEMGKIYVCFCLCVCLFVCVFVYHIPVDCTKSAKVYMLVCLCVCLSVYLSVWKNDSVCTS